MLSKPDSAPVNNNLKELVDYAQKISGIRTKRKVLIYAMQKYIEYLEGQYSKSGQSFYELTKHLAGSVDGPSDLAHNKHYLDEFGR